MVRLCGGRDRAMVGGTGSLRRSGYTAQDLALSLLLSVGTNHVVVSRNMNMVWSWRGADLSGAQEWEMGASFVAWEERRARRMQQEVG